MLRAQNRLRAYDSLSRELTELMEKAQLQVSTNMLIEARAQSKKRSVEQNFETIRECDISYDDKESPTWTPSFSRQISEAGIFTYEPDPTIAHYRLGRLGKLRVTYASFSARSDHVTAVERAEEELKQLSRVRHPNVAVVVGVTKGYDGLNGFVVATDGAPIMEVLTSAVPGGVLARCIQGLVRALDFFHEWDGSGDSGLDIQGYGITLAPDGHVTVVLSGRSMSYDGRRIPGWATDPTMSMVLRTYYQARKGYKMGEHTQAERMSKLLQYLASLGQSHLTELQALKVMGDCGFRPFEFNRLWSGSHFPPFTVYGGDLGRVTRGSSGKEEWEVLEAGNTTCNEISSANVSEIACREGCQWRTFPGTNPQYRTWVTSCSHEYIWGPVLKSTHNSSWEDVVKRAKNVAKQQDIKLAHISYVSHVGVTFSVGRKSTSKHPVPIVPLYFHRNILSRLSPRDFWGFFGASPDPCAQSTGIDDTNWPYNYHMGFTTMRIGDDWGLRYQRTLESSLAAMPGAYPRAHVEELSNGEAQ
ncbi:hypothetical protein BDV93DRAFT_607756 [Ceratobasidium sp. AG-I]|nr:hypothetical protein BDV93DRAFT_607756 [Ceratobasidium sp. AG-I]